MILNYDKDLDVFSSGLTRLFKGSSTKQRLRDINKNADKYEGFFHNVNVNRQAGLNGKETQPIEAIAKAWGVTDDAVLKYTSSAQDAVSSEGFKNSIKDNVTSIQSIGSTVGSTLKSVGKGLLSTGLNMAGGLAIGFAIDKIIGKIYELATASKRTIEEGQQARADIEETYSDYSGQLTKLTSLGSKYNDQSKSRTQSTQTESQSIQALGEKYAKLREGVNGSNNTNLKLSDEDYSSYLDISNQLATIYPELQVNTDATGNAILNIGKSGKIAGKDLLTLVDAQRKIAHTSIGKDLDKSTKGYLEEQKGLQEQITKKENEKSQLSDIYWLKNDKKTKNRLKKEAELYHQSFQFLEDQVSSGKDGQEYIPVKFQYEGTNIPEQHKQVNAIVNKFANDINGMMDVGATGLDQKIAELKNQQAENLKEQIPAMQDFLQTSKNFVNAPMELQNSILSNLGNIDVSKLTLTEDETLRDFLNKEYIDPIKDMKPEAEKELGHLLEIDPSKFTANQYQQKVEQALKNSFPRDKEMQESWKGKLGLDTALEEAQTQQFQLMRKFGDNAQQIRNLTGEDRDLLFTITIEDDGFNGSFDNAMKKVQALKKESQAVIDLEPTAKLDAAVAAQSATDQEEGSNYDKATAVFKQAEADRKAGLIGTKRFKKAAALASPNDMDDVGNWNENARQRSYFTEDRSGVDKFMKDLASRTDDAGQSMATLDKKTGQYKLRIVDLREAANKMGMSFEGFMSVMGKTQEYGLNQNFVSSTQDGVEKLSSLYGKLGDEQGKLSDLQRQKAAGDRAISAETIKGQEAKVQELKDSIAETGQSMENLIAHSVDESNRQVTQAKDGLKAMQEMRQQLISDPGKYGNNHDEVQKALEDQMTALADEYGVTLDLDFNVEETPQDAVDQLTGGEPVTVNFKLLQDDELTTKRGEKAAESYNRKGSDGEYFNDVSKEYATMKEKLGEPIDISFDVNTESIQSVNDQISMLTEMIQTTSSLHNADGSFDINSAGGQEALDLLNALIQKKSELGSVPVSVSVNADAEGAKEQVDSLVSKISELNTINTYQSIGINVDSGQIDQAKADIASLLQQIADSNGNSINLTANVTNADELETVKAVLEQMPPGADAQVNCTVSGEDQAEALQQKVQEIKSAGGANINLDCKVKYDESEKPKTDEDINMHYKKASQEDPEDKPANVNYHLGTQDDPGSPKGAVVNYKLGSVEKPPAATVRVNYDTSGKPKVNGTAHSSGTFSARALASGTFNTPSWFKDRWKIKKAEDALTGEIAPEMMVTGNHWELLGQHGAEFRHIPAGAVIFNHLQTKELLKKGYTTSRGKIQGGTGRMAQSVPGLFNGTAHVDGTAVLGGIAHKSGTADFEDTIDLVEINLKRLAEAIEEFAYLASDYYTGYISQNKMIDKQMQKTNESINNHMSGYNTYIQKANAIDISQDWKNKIMNGQMDVTTIKDENLSKKVKEFQDLWDKSVSVRKEIIELNTQIQKLNTQKLDNVEKSFDAFTNTAEQIYSGFNALNELLEAQGKNKSWTNTLEMLGQKGTAETSLRGEVEQLRALENQMLANGSLKKWSKEYYELETRIIGVQQKLYETQAEEYKLREELRKIQWQPWQDALDKIDAVNDELDDTYDLLKDLTAFNKDSGLMNDNGLAQLGILTNALGNARQAVEDYNVAFEALNTELQNGNINQEQYNKQLLDLKSKQRDSIADVKKYRDAIVDLIKDGIDAETNAMSKLVSKQQENLKVRKDADDYARTMRDKTKEINKIQAQIAALEGDNSAKVRNLKNQLKEAQQDLGDTQKNHRYDELNKGYDDAMDKFKEVQDNEKDLLNSSLEEQTKAIQDMLNSAKNQYATTYDELEELAATYGFHLSEDLANPWKTAANAVDAYNKAVGNVTANGIPATGKVPGLNGGTNNVTYSENNPSAPDNNVKANQQANANKGLVSGGSGLLKSGSRGGAVTNLQNALNALGFNAGKADGIFGKNTRNALVAFQRASGVSADGILGPNTRKQFAARGYEKGTKLIPYTGIALTDEQGAGSEVVSSQGVWRQVEHGDTVFNSEQVRMLYDMTSNPEVKYTKARQC
ncbi:MAG: hypothetical protein [Bacteriophage sp.]|nr:MAG: hypothetical protein [Bacteriophage sp.]